MKYFRNKGSNNIKNKFKELTFIKKNLILIGCCFLLLTISSIGYAALNQTLNITGDLALRAVKDIRISELKLISTDNDGYELYNPKYTENTITLNSNLINVNASTTYQASITNYGNVDMEIGSINKELSSSTGFSVTINNIIEEEVIKAGETKTFNITLKKEQASNVEQLGVVIQINFQEVQTRYLAYKIEGNSVQNGDPSPANPVDILSVGNKKNLFNLKDRVSEYTTYTEDEYGIWFKPVEQMKNTGWSLYSEEQLTVSYDIINYNIRNFKVIFVYSDGTTSETESSGTNSITAGEEDLFIHKRIVATSVADKIVTGIRFDYNHVVADNDNYAKAIIKDFQIEKGTSDTTYSESEYNIPIKVSGKNILNKDDSSIEGIRNETGFTAFGNEAFSNNWIIENLKPSTTYTISYDVECLSVPEYDSVFSKTIGLTIYSSISGHIDINTTYFGDMVSGEKRTITKTFTTPSNLHDKSQNYRILAYTTVYKDSEGTNVMSTMKFTNIQIEEGSTATDYAPYVEPKTYNIALDEPLRGIGDYKDIIDFKTGTIVRNIGRLELDGSETWLKDGIADEDVDYFYIANSGITSSNINNVLSTHFIKGNNKTEGFWGSSVFVITINKKYTNITSSDTKEQRINKFKDWLITQKNTGKPINVYYSLTTPVTNTITLPEIIKEPYYTKYEVLTDVQPSDFTYEYFIK